MTKLKVLLLDDNPEDAFLVTREVEEVAVVEVARTRKDFEEKVQQKWDVILADLALPGFDGTEGIRISKAHQRLTPVIIVTGSVDAREADRACDSGAARFFIKGHLEGLSRALKDVHEKALLEEQVIRDNRLEILGHTTLGFTHDLNNLLQVFLGGPEILRKLVLDELHNIPESIARVLDAMESTGRRGAEMSKQIATFIRGSNGSSLRVVSVAWMLTELGKLLRDSFPKNIEMHFTTLHGTSAVKCDATQIIQLLLNLCVNARDVMPNGGKLDVMAQNVGKNVMIRVHDNGPGIAENVLPHIFEPFFTTKPVSKGTGLGLSMAAKIATDHGGELRVSTSPEGTSFYLYLPVAKEETRQEAITRMEEFSGSGQTILIIDDEASMRMLLEMLVVDAGYAALLAANGMEALSFFRSNATISAVLTDVGMAVMSGQQILEALRAQNYDVPVVFMTGTADLEAFDPKPNAVLKKPFTRQSLLETLANVLVKK